jgi:glycosyltransferase involved in cell wall biosynthesis
LEIANSNMNLLHWVRKENSGLFRSTLELATYEEKQGHLITLRQPTGGEPIYGNGSNPDVELVHSQMSIESYYNNVPKFMWMHGEPLSSVGNRISMKAIVDLAPAMDAFICMREEERAVWNSIKRTYYVPKGIDLELFRPIDGITERLAGEPAVLYVENWRGQRNPLYLCVAMQQVWQKYPKARLHLLNCNDKKMRDMFQALIKNNGWWTFTRTLSGAISHQKVNEVYNKADIVVSCLYPLYARGIEAFGAGKAFIGPGYKVDDYPFTCELHPDSIAQAIIDCWENYDKVDYRKWAESHHDVAETVKQSVGIYERYL